MDSVIPNINHIEELMRFANDKQIIEIVMRDKKKKYKTFQKVCLGKIGQNLQQQSMLNNLFQEFNKSNQINMKNIVKLNNIAKLNKIGLIFDSLNLCATAAGFAVMYMKLNKISNQINEVLSTVKMVNDTQTHYEFKKILSTHSDMLDCRKKNRYYTEEQMRELVDGEYNVLCMLLDVLRKGTAKDTETLLYSIISLSSMFSVSLKYFDEIYYFNNKDLIKGDDIWHSTHDSWVKVYDELISKNVVEKFQDFCMFELSMNTYDCDLFCNNIINTFKEAKESIVDNQDLLIAFDNDELLNSFKEINNNEIKNAIEDLLNDSDILSGKEINDSLKQVGII